MAVYLVGENCRTAGWPHQATQPRPQAPRRRVGLFAVPDARVTDVAGRDVLLMGRFDRTEVPAQRRLMVSALIILGLHEQRGYDAAYGELAYRIRAELARPQAALRDLFSRIVFDICIGNTDDHARNHAAFWDGCCA